jgi:g-D-glutamyl-meso-diaminopimelate peptidase
MRVLRPGTYGSDVMEVQALLKKMGLDPGTVDGRFGPRTQSAVSAFQRRFGLVPDGIVGANTWKTLDPFLKGYDVYFVRPGDTLYAIARKYGTQLPLLLAANPGVDPRRLAVGQRIVVPYNFAVVDTNIGYTWAVLQRDVQGLKVRYPFIETGIIGQSVLGKDLYYLRLGTGPRTVMYNAAHHALEWITSPVLMKFAEDYAKAYALGQTLKGFRPADMWDSVSIYIVPMVNPDGVDLVIDGLQPGNPYYNDLIRWNKNSTDFSQDWEANIRGVDLNHNYNAAWEQSKQAEEAMGITGPGPTRYSGPYPESEPESRAMADFTREKNPRLVMAYHSQGEVIFWDFENLAPTEAQAIGKQLSALSGYRLASPEGIASYAGYKDWFIQDYRRPGYTIEVGQGKNPLPISQFDTIYTDNLPMLLYAATA